MKKFISFILLTAVIVFTSSAQTTPPSNKIWTSILKRYVNPEGLVNYKGIIKDKAEFQKYLDMLSHTPPQESWSKNDQEAYWINVYNAFTVKLIIDYYPVKSIKDIGPKPQIVFINTPWQKKFFYIGKEHFKLDRIEHQILRKEFSEPRIHFAIVCASMSCAKLRREAYEGDRLDEQLKNQAIDFLTDRKKNKITSEKAELSSYFTWFKSDFEKNGQTVIGFINQYSPVKMKKDANITFLDYNWSLNEQK